MEALVSFAACLLTLRLAGLLAARWRARRAPELAFWAAGLASYALAAGALAWGAAAGWDGRAFRVYYLFGGLLTTVLLGTGSLVRAAPHLRGAVRSIVLVYCGLAVGAADDRAARGGLSRRRCLRGEVRRSDLHQSLSFAWEGCGTGGTARAGGFHPVRPC